MTRPVQADCQGNRPSGRARTLCLLVASALVTLVAGDCKRPHPGTCGEHDGACPGLCGNGIVETGSGEQCDDGNTLDSDGCDSACQVECNREALWPCIPDEHTCCPDEWGVETSCHDVWYVGNVCMRTCAQTSDCYWDLGCREGVCDFVPCGPGFPDAELNRPCRLDDGTMGWCWIARYRTTPQDPGLGGCADLGSLAQGAVCPAGLIDRSEAWCDYCDADFQSPTGNCQHFCNWEDAYSDAIYGTDRQVLPCPPGSNCFAGDVLDASGLHQMTASVCRDIAEAPTCSLVTDQILSDPASTCSDLLEGGRCSVVETFDGPALGQLVGRCQTVPIATPGLTPWDPCEPAVDWCPAGSVCEAEDFFGSGVGQRRCLPYCDTAHHDGVTATCLDLGIEVGENGDATPVCTSLSVAYEPLDIYPTRLGYCALAPGAP
jgi:cysteine-rich repeat protein